MNNSEKFKHIMKRLNDYSAETSMYNSNGYADEAKHFEVLAKSIAEVDEKKFKNANFYIRKIR